MYMCGGKMKYGFGSWLKENAGAVGTIAGAGLGTLIAPGIGTQIGASIGGQLGGAVQQSGGQQQQIQQQQQEAIKQQLISNLPAQSNYVPTFAMGGDLPITDRIANIDNGQTHEQSAIGGVPMGQNALTEVGEVVFKNKAGKKYVFTNRF